MKARLEKSDSWEENYSQTGFFNISSMAKKKMGDKRKRKGLGDMKPREKNAYGQIVVFGTTYGVAKTISAPLERVRIIQQTQHMQNLRSGEKIPVGSLSLLSSNKSIP